MPLINVSDLLVAPSEAETLDTILQALAGFGFNTTAWQVGSVQRYLVTAIAKVVAQVAATVAMVAAFGALSTATGPALTKLADSDFDVQRFEAVKTQGIVRLTNVAGIGATVIAISQLVVSDPITGQTFRNISGGTIPGTVGATLDLTFESEVAGKNTVVAVGSLTIMQTPIAGVTSSNSDANWITQTGADAETDPNLRARCRAKWGTLNVGSKPVSGYEYLARTADPAVTRVYVDPTNPNGPGTVRVYIAGASGTGTGSMVTAVDALIQQKRSVTALVTVLPAVAVAEAFTATVFIASAQNTPSTRESVRLAINDFVNALPIGGIQTDNIAGQEMSHTALIGAVQAVPGVRSVTFSSPTADVPLAANEVLTVLGGNPTLAFVSV